MPPALRVIFTDSKGREHWIRKSTNKRGKLSSALWYMPVIPVLERLREFEGWVSQKKREKKSKLRPDTLHLMTLFPQISPFLPFCDL
jgi:hypothetical protein